MTTAYTPLLGLALPVTGELSGTWGDTVNNGLTSLLDSAIAGTITITVDADTTLSTTQGSANTARMAILLWTAGGTATRTIFAPNQSKIYTVINASSSTQSIILAGVSPVTTGVTIAKGESALCAWNGSDFIKISNTAGPGTFTNLTVTGNTTLGDAVTDTITVNSQFVTGTILRSAQANTNTLSLAAYDVDGAAYTNLITLTASNTPTLALTSTGVGTINNMSIGATTASTGAFTTLTSNAATTFTAGTASTTTGTGTLVVTGGLGVSGRINAANFDGIVGANTAAAGSFTTLSATGTVYSGTTGTNGSFNLNRTSDGATAVGLTLSGNDFSGNNGAAGAWLFKVSNTTIANISSTGLAVTGTFSSTLGATIQGLTVGLGAGAVSTNTAVGVSALVANTTGSRSVAIGDFALSKNTTGIRNVAVGSEALGDNTTGSYNTAVGWRAMVTNTTGTYNIAVGDYALLNNTFGGNNTAVGSGSLQSNTTASYNTAVGYQAATTNTTGTGITAVGYSVLSFNTTGVYNTAVGGIGGVGGYTTLNVNTTGSYNTAMGMGALGQNTTASNNTAVGYQAGYANTTGQIDAFGNQALRANTTGLNNVGIGNGALYSNTTGGGNTALGHSALLFNTTASNNTAVGYQAGYTNQTGTRSVLVGATAGRVATALDGDTHIGYAAGFTQNTGFANTLVGGRGSVSLNNGAGFSLTSGTYNTFIGGSAGSNVNSGSKNTILGNYDGLTGLDIRTASNYIVLSDGDGNIGFSTVKASGTQYSWALPGASNYQGVGITFPATQSASSNANTLDDYEEGTWTVTIGASTTDPSGIAYSNQQAGYTKIGNVVYIRFRVSFSFTSATGSGSLEIRGLPFTSANGVSHPRLPPQTDNITYTGFTYLDIGANANTTTAGFGKNRSGNTASSVLIGDCAFGGTDINGGFFYFV